MELIKIAKMTSKGQVTVPAPIRGIFNLKKGSSVIFKVTNKGVFFLPCEIKERDTYTQEEWGKIERLVAEHGKSYKTSKGARGHLKSL
jgi:AbrB family looped-hinge helix DNA binding protein